MFQTIEKPLFLSFPAKKKLFKFQVLSIRLEPQHSEKWPVFSPSALRGPSPSWFWPSSVAPSSVKPELNSSIQMDATEEEASFHLLQNPRKISEWPFLETTP
ncbi:hypothetical protein NPIL_410381 [Nephila pilipes]|uniref:Uncharacterized protein n=1 Tax=Nephila pilipes TaxID=299642 RepID=A0A8X6T722_NEPPI|nr:hypothetical protein NPIL_410381 [Nephila pilipes]